MAQKAVVPDDTVGWVLMALGHLAAERGLSIAPFDEACRAIFRGDAGAADEPLSVVDLPSDVRAIRVGRYAVLVGSLPEVASSAAVIESVRRYRNQCVVARSYLSTLEATDLQLLLIGPRGSEQTDDWTPLSLLVERDDRVARKLVWLRPTDPSQDDASFRDFAKRTFLARPWTNPAVFTMAALDSLQTLAWAEGSEISRDTVGRWADLALIYQDDPEALVDALVASMVERDAS